MRLTDYSSESSENTYSQMASTDFGMWFYSLGKYQTSFLVNRCHKTEGFHSCFLHPESNLKTQTDFRKLFIFSITQIIISIIILSISQNTRLCHPLTRKITAYIVFKCFKNCFIQSYLGTIRINAHATGTCSQERVL